MGVGLVAAERLSEAQFHGDAGLDRAQFDQRLDLSGALATDLAKLPPGWTLAPDADNRLRHVVPIQATPESVPPPPPTPR